MPDQNGIIRWRDLGAAMDTIRLEMQAIKAELRTDSKKLEEGQEKNRNEIAQVRADVASTKTELRIFGLILMGLLLAIIGLFINHLGAIP